MSPTTNVALPVGMDFEERDALLGWMKARGIHMETKRDYRTRGAPSDKSQIAAVNAVANEDKRCEGVLRNTYGYGDQLMRTLKQKYDRQSKNVRSSVASQSQSTQTTPYPTKACKQSELDVIDARIEQAVEQSLREVGVVNLEAEANVDQDSHHRTPSDDDYVPQAQLQHVRLPSVLDNHCPMQLDESAVLGDTLAAPNMNGKPPVCGNVDAMPKALRLLSHVHASPLRKGTWEVDVEPDGPEQSVTPDTNFLPGGYTYASSIATSGRVVDSSHGHSRCPDTVSDNDAVYGTAGGLRNADASRVANFDISEHQAFRHRLLSTRSSDQDFAVADGLTSDVSSERALTQVDKQSENVLPSSGRAYETNHLELGHFPSAQPAITTHVQLPSVGQVLFALIVGIALTTAITIWYLWPGRVLISSNGQSVLLEDYLSSHRGLPVGIFSAPLLSFSTAEGAAAVCATDDILTSFVTYPSVGIGAVYRKEMIDRIDDVRGFGCPNPKHTHSYDLSAAGPVATRLNVPRDTHLLLSASLKTTAGTIKRMQQANHAIASLKSPELQAWIGDAGGFLQMLQNEHRQSLKAGGWADVCANAWRAAGRGEEKSMLLTNAYHLLLWALPNLHYREDHIWEVYLSFTTLHEETLVIWQKRQQIVTDAREASKLCNEMVKSIQNIFTNSIRLDLRPNATTVNEYPALVHYLGQTLPVACKPPLFRDTDQNARRWKVALQNVQKDGDAFADSILRGGIVDQDQLMKSPRLRGIQRDVERLEKWRQAEEKRAKAWKKWENVLWVKGNEGS